MGKLYPVYRILPPFLIVYGVFATFGNMMELRISSDAALYGSSSYEARMLYFIAAIRGFYEFFFFAGIAAVVAGVNKYLVKGNI